MEIQIMYCRCFLLNILHISSAVCIFKFNNTFVIAVINCYYCISIVVKLLTDTSMILLFFYRYNYSLYHYMYVYYCFRYKVSLTTISLTITLFHYKTLIYWTIPVIRGYLMRHLLTEEW